MGVTLRERRAALARFLARRAALPLTALVATGCGSEPSPSPSPSPLAACPETQIAQADGSCVPVGVPPIGCAAGFVAEANGCAPLLPSEPCPDGTLALPGDSECHELSSCGQGTWGDIPSEAGTQYVDAAYGGADGDGTPARPWTSIAAALGAASPGAIVAIAAGSYPESAPIIGKPVRLWGRCPALVELVGQPGDYAAIDVEAGADGSEVRGLAVRGSTIGLSVSGSVDVRIESVWLHDTDDRGLDVEDSLGPTSATIHNLLVERAAITALYVGSASVQIDGAALRDGRPTPQGDYGRGITIEGSPPYATPSTVDIRRALVERNVEGGVTVTGSALTLEASVIRDTQVRASDQLIGRGLDAITSTVTVRSSVVERNYEYAISCVHGSACVVDNSVMRDTRSVLPTGIRGGGLNAYESQLLARGVLLEGNRSFGLSVVDASVRLERALIRGTLVGDNGLLGDGVVLLSIQQPTELQWQNGRVESSARAGVAAFGSTVRLDHAELECNTIQLDAEPIGQRPASFADLGGNVCGCQGEHTECQAVTTSLEPPLPPE